MGVLGPGTSSIITQSFKILSILENHKLPSLVNLTQNLYLQHSLIKGKSDRDNLGKPNKVTHFCVHLDLAKKVVV